MTIRHSRIARYVTHIAIGRTGHIFWRGWSIYW